MPSSLSATGATFLSLTGVALSASLAGCSPDPDDSTASRETESPLGDGSTTDDATTSGKPEPSAGTAESSTRGPSGTTDATTSSDGSSGGMSGSVCADGVAEPGELCPVEPWELTLGAVCLASGDVNGNGTPDLLFVNSEGEVRFGVLGKKYFEFRAGLDVTDNEVYDCAAGDFDGDGDADLALGIDNSIVVAFSDGIGSVSTFTTRIPVPGGDTIGVAAGDFFGHGLDELAGSIEGEGLVAYLNEEEERELDGPYLSPILGSGGRVAAGPIDAHAGDDLIVGDAALARVHVVSGRLGDGGLFEVTGHAATSGIPGGLLAADFDRDGNLDVAVAIPAADTVDVLLGDGTAGFGPATSHGVGDRPVDVAVGDVDRDGTPDIITANATDRSVSVLLNDGAGAFSTAYDIDVSSVGTVAPTDVLAMDVTRDGFVELLTSGEPIAIVSFDP